MGVKFTNRCHPPKGIKIFFFHESVHEAESYELLENSAYKDFNTLAKLTGGAVFPFDVNSPEVVKLLLEAIAYYASQGLQALKQLDTPGAKKLLQAMAKTG